jgi:ADP-ribosylglycohydrolase
MSAALRSLDGLSVGDALGECFLSRPGHTPTGVDPLPLPAGPWLITDDTVMALSIVRVLHKHGYVQQDELAIAFAGEFHANPYRGYGRGAAQLLQQVYSGMPWRQASRNLFGGQGSLGNGGAMRAAPLGAYFAHDPVSHLIAQARASAEVTHGHPEGQAGAVAVALAAAWHAVTPAEVAASSGHEMIRHVLLHLEEGPTRDGLQAALRFPLDANPLYVGLELGNGSQVTAPDTVPFCLWMACRHPNEYCGAIWTTIRCFGDIDTNCAIVGGILAASPERDRVPQEWLRLREPLHALA